MKVDKELGYKQIIEGLKKFKKEGWIIETLKVSWPLVEDPKYEDSIFYKKYKPGPEISINLTLINLNSE